MEGAADMPKPSMSAAIVMLAAALFLPAQVIAQDEHDQLTREIFRELIEIDTSQGGSTTLAAEAMAARLRDAGLADEDIHLPGARNDRGSLVARYRGRGSQRPIVLLAHLDVVEARREDWSFDPYKLLEMDGYFYGRGTSDDKAMAAIRIANMIRYKREGWTPERNIIVALTADEETGGPLNGAKWLLDNHPQLVDGEFCLNEGGGGQIKNGRYIANTVQATLVRVLANDQITVTHVAPPEPSPPSPLRPEIMGPIERLTEEFWPGVTVLPVMSTGATDGLYFRNAGLPTYGVSGLFGDVDDSRAHWKDERIGVKQLYEGREFLYRLAMELGSN